jgi:opacity protein-like surface antigen
MGRLHNQKPCGLIAALLLCTAAAAAAAAAGVAAVPSAADDFGSQIVQEAVDLNAAHTDDQEPDAKEMESLLHWAIGKAPSLQLLQPLGSGKISTATAYMAAKAHQVEGRSRR